MVVEEEVVGVESRRLPGGRGLGVSWGEEEVGRAWVVMITLSLSLVVVVVVVLLNLLLLFFILLYLPSNFLAAGASVATTTASYWMVVSLVREIRLLVGLRRNAGVLRRIAPVVVVVVVVVVVADSDL